MIVSLFLKLSFMIMIKNNLVRYYYLLQEKQKQTKNTI